ncbi:MAG: OstA-like protein [Spirosomataceae bacterium]
MIQAIASIFSKVHQSAPFGRFGIETSKIVSNLTFFSVGSQPFVKLFRLFFIQLALLGATILATKPSYGQVTLPPPTTNDNRVEILHADSLVGIIQDGVMVRRLVGNVRLKQKTTYVNCTQAILNELTNVVDAYGKVRIMQGDSVTLTGDSATYYGNYRQANLRGKTVTMNDKISTLTSKKLDYDLNTGIAIYSGNSKLVDKNNTLTSQEGVYNTRSKIIVFKNKVKLLGKSEENNKPYTLTADSMRYSTRTKVATFIAPTKVISEKDTLLAKTGIYDTKNRSSYFDSRTTIRTEEYDITGDTLFYDKNSEKGLARGNVILVSRKDKTILYGQYGNHDGKGGISRVYGKPLLKSLVGKDTLYLSADTLLSIENKVKKERKLFAYKHVLIYKTDMQGKCDSLIYNTTDSSIFFYQKPILWNEGNQSEADSIQVFLVNNKLNKMYLRSKAFVVSTDTIQNFNQVKGRKINAFFNAEGGLEKVFVDGNGESIYFALDDKNKLIGMNRVQCSKMNLNFLKGKVKRIAFVGKPDASFIPPVEINPENKALPNFAWRPSEKPTKQQTIERSQKPTLPVTNAPSQRPNIQTSTKQPEKETKKQ